MSNYQVAQNAMLKFRLVQAVEMLRFLIWKYVSFFLQLFSFYNEFLLAHDRVTAKEIRDEYIETTSKMYYSYFKTYSSKLLKLQVNDAFLYISE